MTINITKVLDGVTYLPDRSPGMSLDGGAAEAFAELSKYRDGAIYVGHYSGSSEWERHTNGDEIVMVLSGSTTVVTKVDGEIRRTEMKADDLLVVPRGTWHHFENSTQLKVMTVTPQPTDHQLDEPDD